MDKIRVMMVREGRTSALRREITSPGEAFQYIKQAIKPVGLDRECFWRIDLDSRNGVLGWELVSMGTLNASLVHPREVFTGALLNKAAGIIIAHNHPSGETNPSPEDKDTTRRLCKAGEILGVALQDHLVIGNGKYFSFKETGLL
ncbi:MAG: JAB domain-containing protein [Patescibacteria group bacterium]|nr:JAB domain-containing protein [Patescibacteria group bacterium]